MEKENQAFYGITSFESPYSIHRDGIAFRSRLVLQIGENTSRKTCDEIAKCLNLAFQKGFSEGAAEMGKTLNPTADKNEFESECVNYG